MASNAISQLDKVLAMADSAYDGEALAAVRKARQMLSRDGLSFSDLARAAQKQPNVNVPMGLLSGSHIVNLENEVLHLRQQIDELRLEKVRNEVQLSLLRQRAQDLDQKLLTSQAEASRWKKMARDSVEKLWDLSQSMQHDEDTIDPPSAAKIA